LPVRQRAFGARELSARTCAPTLMPAHIHAGMRRRRHAPAPTRTRARTCIHTHARGRARTHAPARTRARTHANAHARTDGLTQAHKHWQPRGSRACKIVAREVLAAVPLRGDALRRASAAVRARPRRDGLRRTRRGKPPGWYPVPRTAWSAWYPPGMVSHPAWYCIRHAAPHSMVSRTPRCP
jgi:hypothetical protein